MSLLTQTMWRWTVSWTFRRAQMKTERCFDLPLLSFMGLSHFSLPHSLSLYCVTHSPNLAFVCRRWPYTWWNGAVCLTKTPPGSWRPTSSNPRSRSLNTLQRAHPTLREWWVAQRLCVSLYQCPCLLVAVCVCVFVCVGLLPAPSSCRFKAPLMLSSGPSSCGLTHSHTHALLLWPVQTTNCVFNAEQK